MTLATAPLDDLGSFAWRGAPGEWMERASCAIATVAGTLLVDPVDAPGLDDALAALPPVHAVVTLLDRHQRDAAAVAARLGVPRLAPGRLATGAVGALAVPGVEAIPVPALPRWTEVALWLPSRGLLVVPEAVGTAAYYRAGDEPLGVHPLLRLRPPRALLAATPRAIACGHGDPLVDDAAVALADAVRHARRRLPAAWLDAARAARARRAAG